MLLFHRIGASMICLAFFLVFITWGLIKLVVIHWPMWVLFRSRKSGRFMYHFTKALDHAACAGTFGGKNDETMSNRAGQIFLRRRFNSPWWVLVTKKLTDRWEPDHVIKSVEPTREEPDWLDGG